MSEDERLEWFPCNPAQLLGALAGMRSPKGYTYVIILLRIYECGGACPDTLDALSMRTKLNKRVVADALDALFNEGRLYRGDGGIRNPKADGVIESSIGLREKRKTAGANGGKRASENRKRNQGEEVSNTTSKQERGSTPLQLQEQDSLFSNENRVPPPDPKPDRKPMATRAVEVVAAVPDDGWPEDHLEQFWKEFPSYRLAGKAKVGEKLARLRRDKVVAWGVLISGVKRYAATSPGEYASGPMPWLNGAKWDGLYGSNQHGGARSGEDRNSREPKLGYAGIAARIRQQSAERADGSAAFEDPAGDRQRQDGCGFAAAPVGGVDRAGQASTFEASDNRR